MVSFKNILKVTCVLSTLIYNAFAAPSIINKRNGILSKLTPAVNELTHLPPSNKVPARGTVTGQTPEEFAQIKKHAGIAISSYCNDVNQWRCESCRESVPDGHIVASFKTLKYDMTGFILHSDRDQTIYLVFRGTMSIRNIIPVSINSIIFLLSSLF
jgi:hypothetical protein